mmetsp:Transcript_37539/g.90225  ORF Transcript_37539/g.90225 Transcript_37539/m.90225 type:complete len:246 (-) Transcript_37539:117-854(-)
MKSPLAMMAVSVKPCGASRNAIPNRWYAFTAFSIWSAVSLCWFFKIRSLSTLKSCVCRRPIWAKLCTMSESCLGSREAAWRTARSATALKRASSQDSVRTMDRWPSAGCVILVQTPHMASSRLSNSTSLVLGFSSATNWPSNCLCSLLIPDFAMAKMNIVKLRESTSHSGVRWQAAAHPSQAARSPPTISSLASAYRPLIATRAGRSTLEVFAVRRVCFIRSASLSMDLLARTSALALLPASWAI